MRALFVGGTIDNNEMDLEDGEPSIHYPENTGGGQPRYRLHQIGKSEDGSIAYVVYGAPDLADEVVDQIAEERAYARRFDARPERPPEAGSVPTETPKSVVNRRRE